MSIRDLSIAVKLYISVGTFVAGLLLFGIIARDTLETVRIGSPLYSEIIENKDLLADVLPPPEYIIEPYLLVLQALNAKDSGQLGGYAGRFQELKKEYDGRRTFWTGQLEEGKVKDMLLKETYPPARDFFETGEKEFFPALLAQNHAKAQELAVGSMKTRFEEHRASIEKLAKTASDHSSEDEKTAITINNRRTLYLLMLGMIIAAATALISAFIIRQITRPLTNAVQVVTTIAAGDLTSDIKDMGRDETGKLLAEMQNMSVMLRRIVGEIKASSESVASASQQLSSSSEQMSRGVTEQSGRAAQIATSATEMSQTSIDVARNASSISTSATETAEIAKHGAVIVEKSIAEVRDISLTVVSSARLISSLGERSKHIGDIVGVIKDIADQTNLLALNAAIEAARAGDQGRGFAVVADEVRKLAERTGKATAEIGEMIGAIQMEVEKAVASMNEASSKVEVGVADVTTAGDALEKIVGSVESLQAMIQQIATATEQISSVTEAISSDIEAVASVSHETSTSSNQIAQSASDLARLSSGLQLIVGRFQT